MNAMKTISPYISPTSPLTKVWEEAYMNAMKTISPYISPTSPLTKVWEEAYMNVMKTAHANDVLFAKVGRT